MPLSHLDRETSADKICLSVLKNLPPFKIKTALTEEDYQGAFRLVYQEYRKRGFCPPADSQMRFSELCFLPGSRLFILEERGQMTGALSLLADEKGGLPMETSFASEVSAVRKKGRKLAELSLFAVAREAFDEHDQGLGVYQKFRHAFLLFKSMFDYARQAGVADLLIAIHPRQRKLYQALSFKVIGEECQYKEAEGNPALPMHLDVIDFVRNPEISPMRYFFLNYSL